MTADGVETSFPLHRGQKMEQGVTRDLDGGERAVKMKIAHI